jgi:hypothetical protein
VGKSFDCSDCFCLGFWLLILHSFEYLQVIESINKCDVDIRRELFSSILVRYLWFPSISVPLCIYTLASSYVALNKNGYTNSLHTYIPSHNHKSIAGASCSWPSLFVENLEIFEDRLIRKMPHAVDHPFLLKIWRYLRID